MKEQGFSALPPLNLPDQKLSMRLGHLFITYVFVGFLDISRVAEKMRETAAPELPSMQQGLGLKLAHAHCNINAWRK